MARIDPRAVAAVFLGGVLGGIARSAVAELAPADPGRWPWATLAVNLAGAALLGFVATRWPGAQRRRLFLGTGVCGALTTFSTLQLELLRMLDADRWALAAAYAAVSVAGGLAAVWLASTLVRRAGP